MREKIKLVASDGSGHFYTTTVNKRAATEKLKLRKFNPRKRKHMDYVEAKIK
jgi:large subunit ribosomal protein L33